LYSSIFSFSDIYIYLNSERNFEELLILSTLVKSIAFYMRDEVKNWKVKEFPQNH
jgi:hypothetical protein